MDAFEFDGAADGFELEVAVLEGGGLVFEDGFDVFYEFLEVEDAFDGGRVVAGFQHEVGEGGVAEEEVAAEEVQCCVALLGLLACVR